ncbi:DUF4870 domain-containing protein [Couchioplanes caeruleus]|uniref:DUF4870 domain-containing protein n=2 Tax=Couchioplanes caeruleus TaxID=56438 RepID=A0A1K0F9M4_9ACTN|nr:DUF4870 domain-containing protein [Couchioplanes caeruleus]OJF09551.1 hypothetical protein BG844_36990 [Couchioplanes caeruleus subsp. caeruleus]ROP29605.1 hypothetical protein EDD30_2406 [Couchioplanes caeruleus]
MTEPPRPPGEGNPSDPTAPLNPYPGSDPTGAAPPPPPTYGAPQPPPYGTTPPPPTSGAGGYGPPPGSGAPYGGPPPGQPYGAPGAYGQQPGYPPHGYGPGGGDEKTWILVAHFGGAAGAFLGGGCSGWIAPLVAMLAKGNQSPYVRAEAVKALNFQLLWTIIAVIGYATICIGIGIFVAIGAWLVATILGVIAGVKASNNEPYNYPMSVSMIK